MTQTTNTLLKPTHIPWIKEVPEDWDVVRVKNIFDIQKTEVGKESYKYPLLSLTLQGVKFRDIESGFGKFPAEFDTYQIVDEEDLIFCLFDIEETPRTVGLSDKHGMITGAYTVVKMKLGVSSAYYYYLFLSADTDKRLKVYYSGLRNTIKDDNFRAIPIPLPSLSTQIAIANFLDQRTEQISILISNKKKLIDLLKEQKQSIIHRAVTKGIDKNVKMKDSGVSWIGEIPEDCDIRRIKSIILKSKNGAWGDDPKGNPDDIICIRVADFDKNNFGISDQSLTFRNITNCDDIVLSEGDLILEKSGGGDSQLVGRVIYFNKSYRAVTSNFLATIKTKKNLIKNSYFYYVLKACYDMGINYRSIKQTTGIQNLDSDSYFQEQVPLPSLETQKAIVEYIEKETIQIDTAIEKIEKEITLIEEYRTSLIYQAVTGKITIS